VQIKLGRAASAIEIGRLLVLEAARRLDQGERASTKISMAKAQVGETLQLAADTAIQLNGARGYSKDTVLVWIYHCAARPERSASEVHGARFLAVTARCVRCSQA
jgi:acyl-CoA dehydrogenase